MKKIVLTSLIIIFGVLNLNSLEIRMSAEIEEESLDISFSPFSQAGGSGGKVVGGEPETANIIFESDFSNDDVSNNNMPDQTLTLFLNFNIQEGQFVSISFSSLGVLGTLRNIHNNNQEITGVKYLFDNSLITSGKKIPITKNSADNSAKGKKFVAKIKGSSLSPQQQVGTYQETIMVKITAS